MGETWHRLPGNRAGEFMGMAGACQPAVHIWPTSWGNSTPGRAPVSISLKELQSTARCLSGDQ